MAPLIFPQVIRIGGILQSSRLCGLHRFVSGRYINSDPDGLLSKLVDMCFSNGIRVKVNETGIYVTWNNNDPSIIHQVTRYIDGLYLLHIRNRVHQYIDHGLAEPYDLDPLIEGLLCNGSELPNECSIFGLHTYMRTL